MTDGAASNVLDTAPSLAFLKTEPGWEIVAALIEDGVEVCAADLCELMSVLARKGMPEHLAAQRVADSPVEQVVLTFNLAIRAILRSGQSCDPGNLAIRAILRSGQSCDSGWSVGRPHRG